MIENLYAFIYNPAIVLLLILLCYIIFLHIRLIHKDKLIRNYLEEIIDNKSSVNQKELLKFMKSLKEADLYKSVITDKLLDVGIQDFIFDKHIDVKLYLHYTTKEEIANTIIQEGFQFASSFYKTAQLMYNDKLYLIQKHNEHKHYGPYVIVICISKNIHNFYTKKIIESMQKNLFVEQILTETPPVKDENHENVYTLSPSFIKGYFNYMDGSIVKNPNFNPNYQSKLFKQNIEKL